jgi:hypothetical protein
MGFLVGDDIQAEIFFDSFVTGDVGAQALSVLETENIGRRKSADLQYSSIKGTL